MNGRSAHPRLFVLQGHEDEDEGEDDEDDEDGEEDDDEYDDEYEATLYLKKR